MTADFMQQWEQFEHNSAPPGLAAAALTLSYPPARHSGMGMGGGDLGGSVAKTHVARARMLGFTSGTSPESHCSEGGLQRIKLQTYNSVGGSGGEEAKSFSRGCCCCMAILGVCCRYSVGNNSSPTQGNVCPCLGGGRQNIRNRTSSFVDASSVGECLQPWVSVKCFHAGCGAFTSLALKVKGIESLQDVPGRDFWLCQQRA